MRNRHEIRGNVVVIFVGRRSGPPRKFMIDAEDLPKVERFSWRVNGCGYAYTMGKPSTAMSRIIMDTPDDMIADHISRDICDNRKANLRNISKSLNLHNQSRHTRNVYWVPSQQKWQVRFMIGRKAQSFGMFTDRDEAVIRATVVRRQYRAGNPIPGNPRECSHAPGRSGIRGIVWNEIKKRWHVMRQVGGRQRVFGRAKTIDEAKVILARVDAELACA